MSAFDCGFAESEFPESPLKKETPRQAVLLIVGASLACSLAIGLILVWSLR